MGLLVGFAVACGGRGSKSSASPPDNAEQVSPAPEDATGMAVSERVTLSCPTLRGVTFDMPAFPGWEPQHAEGNAFGGCRIPLSHPDTVMFESPPMIDVHAVFGADAGQLNRASRAGGRVGVVQVDRASANAQGVSGGTAFDHSRWVDGYTRRPAQWDYLQLYDPGFVVRIRVDGGGQDHGFDRRAVEAMMLASAAFQRPQLYITRARAVGAVPLEDWSDSRHDAVVAALVAEGASAEGYFAGALGSTGDHESVALWHETAFHDENIGMRGDPVGKCRTAVFEADGIRLLRWQ